MDPSAKVSKKEALAKGLKTYFTGKPCLRGHVAVRMVINSTCSVCLNDRRTAYDKKHVEKHRARGQRWLAKNPEAYISLSARRAAMRARMGVEGWQEREGILAFYWLARIISKNTKVKHQVDHVYPLNGKKSCGLHVTSNLQILPRRANLEKSNKCPETKPLPNRVQNGYNDSDIRDDRWPPSPNSPTS